MSVTEPLTWIVLPAYNEADNLGDLLRGIAVTMAGEGWPYRVVVVDDGSADATATVAREHATAMPLELLVHERNQGLGPTIRDGLRHAAEAAGPADVIVSMDADNSHLPGLIPSLVRRVRAGQDVVIASRYQRGSQIRGVPAGRVLVSLVASWLFRLVFPIRWVRDYTCGYRAYRAEVLRRAFADLGDGFIDQPGFQCMVDILLKLARRGCLFDEAPMVLRYDQKIGPSKMNVRGTIAATLKLMLRRRLGR